MSGANRKHYFGAGPAAMPASVLEQMARDVLDYNRSGISILSIPHRDEAFAEILQEANELVLQLANLDPEEYDVLWLQGGGRMQFAMLPMNFLGPDQQAGYIDSGHWAHDAMKTARYYGNAVPIATSAREQYRQLPAWPSHLPKDLRYLHITSNNTIYGTQWQQIPATPVPLVADMSSDIFSGKRNYQQFSLIYAVAQKNLGPAGVTLIIARKSFIQNPVRDLPDVLSYKAQVKAGSLLNTPPVGAIYNCLLVLRWIHENGLDIIIANNEQKSAMLYAAIDNNPLFQSPIKGSDRSSMNVVFTMKNPEQEAGFISFCKERDIEGIKGHRSVGGFRASLYNAVSISDVELLVQAMKDFIPG